MNTLLGWETYSTDERYCEHCRTFYDKEDQYEHEHCEEEKENDKGNNDRA